MKKFLVVLLIILILGIGGYYLFGWYKNQSNYNVVPTPSISDNINQTSNLSLSDASNQFALNLYSQLKNDNQNIFFSPYSIFDAFGMVYEGAKDKTAQEIAKVFQFSTNDEQRRNNFLTLQNKLNPVGDSYQLNSANALWIQQDFKILDNYLNIIKKYYGGDAKNVDFENNTERARLTINQWVEDQTNNKIKNLFDKGILTRYNRLVLTNAVYFKADWINEFDPSDTDNDKFTTNSGKAVEVPTMYNKTKFDYYSDDNLQILKMPYVGNQLSMTIFLPKNNDIESLEKSLTIANLKKWKNKTTNQEIRVYLPKFTFNNKYDKLAENLMNMGLNTVFTGNANFSGITGKKDLYINGVIHQSFVGVNEKGTEAAAATGVGIATAFLGTEKPKEVPIFRADHPFIFLIQENSTGTILFMGKMNNPKKAKTD